MPTIQTERNEPVLAVTDQEINPALDMSEVSEFQEHLQCLVDQFNLLEVAKVWRNSDKQPVYFVWNYEFKEAQLLDEPTDYSAESCASAIQCYANLDDAMECAIATIASYTGQPQLVPTLTLDP